MMGKNLKLLVATAAAGAVAFAGVASASVTFDSASGTGFVGKGDVQVPFGWNDAALQAKAAGVSFGYEASTDDAYEVTCGWETETGGRGGVKVIKQHTQTKRSSIASSVTYDVTKVDRKNPNGKVTGFKLIGKGTEVIDEAGGVPVVGGECPENEGHGVDKRIEAVVLLSSTSTEALTAYHLADGKSAVIWPPPVV